MIADNLLPRLAMLAQILTSSQVVGEAFTDENYGIAVCKTKTDLVDMLNRGLATVKAQGLIEELTTKWIVNAGN